jgi:DNA repair photolyase
VEVGFTITTSNDKERKIMEPGTKPIQSRIDAMKECNRKGISTYAFFGPLYPTLDEEGMRELVGKIKDAGATCVMVDRLNLKPGVWS